MYAIGIDIGGMSVKGAVVDDNGVVYQSFSLPIIKGETGEQFINKLGEEVKRLIATNGLEKQIVGIGVGCPGTLNTKKGIVNYSNNLGWKDLPLVEILNKTLPYPIKLINDANAAGIGEAKYGAGKMYDHMVMLTLGTGVGGAVIVNGQLIEGNETKGGELGHTVIVVDGEPCSCGRRGCLEAYASASALIRESKKAMLENKDSLMWNYVNSIDEVGGEVSFDAAKEGDKTALKIIDNYVKYLGEGLLNFCNIFRPNVIVLSGGVAKAGEFLFSRLNQYIQKHHYGFKNTPCVEVIPAKLGYDSGKIGAAALFFK